MAVYTIGHSTRPIDDFINLLKLNKINMLVDVRSVAHSRFNPQYNKDELRESLEENNIRYVHLSGLGGFREPIANSVNTGWRNKRFRGYADYMQTKDFSKSLASLIALISTNTVAMMCSEAVPWRCHRSLIADALTIRKIAVYDIYNDHTIKQHTLTEFAHVKNKKITYPP
ncbi:MAG: hypothetical protein Harvfovirus53_12 [Harvfovirus sp.]|uniref:DUF488 domain-containing protein n=1 Tax=Harvfovirus sp. TaxID=2487768 RepID=A0A3G5A3A7_9VIRU|nr:MAG: hypothetical protein Harvfovirus53_12 [Harvfovirus sp.]